MEAVSIKELRDSIEKAIKFIEKGTGKEEASQKGFPEIFEELVSAFRARLSDPLEDGVLAHYKHAIEYTGRYCFEKPVNIIYSEDNLCLKDPSRPKATVS